MTTRGFTLIELLCVVALISILASITLPSLSGLFARMQVQAQAHRLLAATSMARSSAMKQREPVTLCPVVSESGQTERCGGRFDQGYGVAFSRRSNWLRLYPLNDKRIQILNRDGSAPVTQSITWDANGFGNRNLTLSVCRLGSAENWALILNRAGRPRLARGWGSCPG